MILDDFIEINPHNQLRKETEYTFIKMEDIVPGRRYVSSASKRQYSGGGSRFYSGDVLFARITPCLENGKIAQYQGPDNNAFGSTEFIVFREKMGVSFQPYIYYLVSTDIVRKPAEKSMFGASGRQRAALSLIKNIEVPDISLPTQRKIASILSAYDGLIENNLRRIKILEEMAQNIYTEWFVKFRFPGHDKDKMVDSPLGIIPEGWGVKEMRELADVVDCLHSKKPEAIENGHGILLQLFNIGDGGKIDLSKRYLISESSYKLWTNRIEVQSGDCVITNVGRIAAVAQIPVGVKAALGRNMTSVRAKPIKMTPTFLIEYLLSPHMENEVLKKRDSGTIMDSLNVKGIVRLLVPVPPLELLTSFETIARPIRRRIELLVGQNFNLRQTRDLLLPRLISGKFDVSDLDIKTGDDE